MHTDIHTLHTLHKLYTLHNYATCITHNTILYIHTCMHACMHSCSHTYMHTSMHNHAYIHACINFFGICCCWEGFCLREAYTKHTVPRIKRKCLLGGTWGMKLAGILKLACYGPWCQYLICSCFVADLGAQAAYGIPDQNSIILALLAWRPGR